MGVLGLAMRMFPPPKKRNGFPTKAAALKVPLHTARTVNDVVAACLDFFKFSVQLV